MKNRLACRLALACAVLGAFVALVPNASAVLVRGSGTAFGRQQVISITPAAGKTVPPSLLYRPKFRTRPHLANGNLDYNGGGVFHSQAPYVIFWDPSSGISSTTESLIDRYFTDLAHDSGGANNVYGVARQYYDAHGFADYAQTFSAGTQAFVDTAAYPAKDTANCVNTNIPAGNPCLTDPQVQAELTKLIAAHGWPTDGTDPTSLPVNAPEYYVVLPSNVNECSGGGACADNVYCAYHSAYSPDGSNGVIYSMIPLLGSVIKFGTLPGGKGCQFDNNAAVQKPNGDQQADIALKYTSHEQNESITDPVPPTGWFNNELTGSGGENGDECNFFGSTVNPGAGSNPNAFTPTLGGTAAAGDLFNQLDNGNKYYIQSEWSNGDVASGGCVMRPSPGSISPTFTVTPTGGSAVSLNPGASTSTGGFSSVTWSFGDGATSFSHTAPAALSHSYAAAGTYAVKLTLVDTLGNVSSSTQQITVGQPPTGSFSSSPGNPVQGTAVSFTGSASDPNTNVTAAIGWNFGDGSTGTGAVTSHAYANAGTFTVTMAILDSAGHTAFVSHTVTVAKATITKVAVKHKTKKGVTIVVTVNDAGKVSGRGKSKTAGGAGSVSLKIKLTKSQRNKLSRKGKLTLHIKVKYTPNVGSPVTKKVTITFKS